MTWIRQTRRHDHEPAMLSAPNAVHAAMIEPTYQHVLMSAPVCARFRGCATSMAKGPPASEQKQPPNPTTKRPASILLPPVVRDWTSAPAMITQQPMLMAARRPHRSATYEEGAKAGIPPRLKLETCVLVTFLGPTYDNAKLVTIGIAQGVHEKWIGLQSSHKRSIVACADS